MLPYKIDSQGEGKIVTNVHIMAQDPERLHVQEWNVTAIDGTFLGVIEEVDDGYMYTDSFRHLTTFFEGESFYEVGNWVADSFNPLVVH